MSERMTAEQLRSAYVALMDRMHRAGLADAIDPDARFAQWRSGYSTTYRFPGLPGSFTGMHSASNALDLAHHVLDLLGVSR